MEIKEPNVIPQRTVFSELQYAAARNKKIVIIFIIVAILLTLTFCVAAFFAGSGLTSSNCATIDTEALSSDIVTRLTQNSNTGESKETKCQIDTEALSSDIVSRLTQNSNTEESKETKFSKSIERSIGLVRRLAESQLSRYREEPDILLQNENLSDECRKWMEDTDIDRFTSQVGQDWSIYNSFYRNTGIKGFYVDVGASDPTAFSNTYFFDVCLGWDGICIEANPANCAKWDKYKDIRSCKLVCKAVGSEKGTVNFAGDDFAGKVVRRTISVEMDTIENILDEHGVKKVDFLSLDIEGGEIPALKPFPFAKYETDLLVIETATMTKFLDFLLHDNGYWKVTDYSIDDLYMFGVPHVRPKNMMGARHSHRDYVCGGGRPSTPINNQWCYFQY